jgi:hypothetical protein
MSNDGRRKAVQERRRREAQERSADVECEICLHCGNPFRATDGVVTPDAALCDVCNGRD